MSGYVWRGQPRPTPAPEDPPITTRGTERQRRIKAACGTVGGYVKHKRDHTTPCRPCKDAQADAQAARRGSTKRYGERGTPPPHGTYARYGKHIRDGERPCFDCGEARRRYNTAYRAAKRAQQREQERAS